MPSPPADVHPTCFPYCFLWLGYRCHHITFVKEARARTAEHEAILARLTKSHQMEVEQLKQLHAHELMATHSAHEMTLSQARYDRSELRHQQAVAAAHHHLLTTGAVGEASPPRSSFDGWSSATVRCPARRARRATTAVRVEFNELS